MEENVNQGGRERKAYLMIFPEGYPSAFMSLYISAYPLLSRFFGENGTDSLWIDRYSEYFGQGFIRDTHDTRNRVRAKHKICERMEKKKGEQGEEKVQESKKYQNERMNNA